MLLAQNINYLTSLSVLGVNIKHAPAQVFCLESRFLSEIGIGVYYRDFNLMWLWKHEYMQKVLQLWD